MNLLHLYLVLLKGTATSFAGLASLAGGVREHDGRRGHRPGRGVRGVDVHASAWLVELEGTPGTGPQVEVKIRWRWSAIASSNNRSVLVFVHPIKLALTIGIESSFQILEIRSQWLHSLSSSSNRCLSIGHNNRHIWTGSRSDQRAGTAVRHEPRSRRSGGKGDHIAALCRWSGLALPGDALTLAPGAWPSPCS